MFPGSSTRAPGRFIVDFLRKASLRMPSRSPGTGTGTPFAQGNRREGNIIAGGVCT